MTWKAAKRGNYDDDSIVNAMYEWPSLNDDDIHQWQILKNIGANYLLWQ